MSICRSDFIIPAGLTRAHPCSCLTYGSLATRRSDLWRVLDCVEFATLGSEDWLNSHALLWQMGNIPSAETEDCHYAQTEITGLPA
jgi:hypothetical protein